MIGNATITYVAAEARSLVLYSRFVGALGGIVALAQNCIETN